MQLRHVADTVRALAHANEIVVTDNLSSQPGVSDLVDGLTTATSVVRVNGIESDVIVHRLTSAAPVGERHR
jgi:hypothetical protein